MKKIKNLAFVVSLFVVAMSLMYLPAIAPVETTMALDPAEVQASPGESFSVDVVVSNVVDLGGWEFTLKFDADVATCTGVTVVETWFGPTFVWTSDIFGGYIHYVVTLPLGSTVGIDGSGVVATIDFVAKAGSTVLDLQNTGLGEIVTAAPIPHEAIDGSVNLPPELFIEGAGAHGGGVYPLWHVNVAGAVQTLYSRIVNYGEFEVYVKVKFTVYAPGIATWIVESNVETAYPKLVEPFVESVTVSADFTDTEYTTSYFVSGALYFSVDGTNWNFYGPFEDIVGGDGTARDIATKFKTQ